MKHVDESIDESPVNGKSPKEILAHFKTYGFRDCHGHKLELCQDFLELIRLVAKAES